MGAEFMSQTIRATTSREVETKYRQLVRDYQYERGHGGYTGSFAESPGLTILPQEFDDETQAEDYIDQTAKKWEDTLAARIKGTDKWVLGGWFSS